MAGYTFVNSGETLYCGSQVFHKGLWFHIVYPVTYEEKCIDGEIHSIKMDRNETDCRANELDCTTVLL
jgi:hypothetical protein